MGMSETYVEAQKTIAPRQNGGSAPENEIISNSLYWVVYIG